MAARVTQAEVEEIVEIDSSISITPFITVATLIVDEELVGRGLSDARLKEIERYLAAHFYCVRDPRVTSESAGVSASYEGSAGQNLSRTRYGQQAILLDTTGILASMNAAQTRRAFINTMRISTT